MMEPFSHHSAMKHVAHVTFNMDYGGTERVIDHLISNADVSRYHTSIICLDSPIGPVGQQLMAKGIRIVDFKRRPGFDWRLVANLRSHIHDHNIDILHCHQYTPYVYGLLAAATLDTRVIFTEHGRFYPDRRRLKRWLLNPLFRLRTDAITAISRATRRALVTYENFPASCIEVIYNGISFSRNGRHPSSLRRELGTAEGARVLGTVARLDAVKNHPLMVSALALLKDTVSGLRLLIVGDGPERRALEQLIQEVGLADRAIITGWVADPTPYYNIMDLFLLTSFSEGTAMTLLEAMAAGLPCIVTDVGGNPEIVEDGITGFVIPSDDAPALAEKIQLLLSQNALRHLMRRKARDRFTMKFTASQMTHNYEGLYDRLLHSHRP